MEAGLIVNVQVITVDRSGQRRGPDEHSAAIGGGVYDVMRATAVVLQVTL
jgi:hypothetical protein